MFMVALMVVCASAGDLLLKRGMSQMGAVPMTRAGLWQAFLSTLQNPTIWLGILFLIGYTLCYMTAVSWADYSYVMPAGAFGYALQTVLLWARSVAITMTVLVPMGNSPVDTGTHDPSNSPQESAARLVKVTVA